jgi:hypothetical protein
MRLLEAIRAKGQDRPEGTQAAAGRCLRVRVFEGDRGKPNVNITVPLALAKLALKFIPRTALEQLEEQGIKPQDIEELIANVESAAPFRIVDVEADGEKVEVFVE